MQHKCRACGCEAETPESGGDDATPVLPQGWYIRHIEYTDYVLCDVCGNVSHFRGGLSPYLMDALDLDPGARCDVSSEVAEARASRRQSRAHQKES